MTIAIIGDSNTAFFCNDIETLILAEQEIAGYAESNKLMNVDGEDIYLSWIFGKSAYSLTEEMLTNMTKDVNLSNIDYLIFAFGTVDIKVFMYQNKDYKTAIKKYQNLCYSFSKKHNIKIIFLLAITKIEHIKNLNKWNEYFEEHLDTLGRVPIIDVFDKFSMDYNSDSFDEHNHMTLSQSQEVLKYIIERVKSL